MNSWSLAYAAACLALVVAIYRTRSIATRPAWPRVAAWWLGSAVSALVLWSTLACTALPLFGEVGPFLSMRDWSACVVGSGFWASMVIGIVLPFYGLLLSWYTMRFGRESRGWRSVVRNLALLGLPPAFALIYGYGIPAYEGARASLIRALPFAFLGFLAATTGLLLPRVLVRAMGPGRLVRPDAD